MRFGYRMAYVASCAVAGAAWSADITWAGGSEASYLDTANWTGGALPGADDNAWITGAGVSAIYDSEGVTTTAGKLTLGTEKTAGGAFTLVAGELSTKALVIYGTEESPAVYTQTGGKLTLSDDTSVLVRGTARTAARIVVSGGEITGGHMLQLGNAGLGEWVQTAGNVSFSSYVVLGRNLDNWGYMTVTGGKFEQTARDIMLVGEDGNGELTVGGNAQFFVPQILMGRKTCASSTVRLSGTALLRTGSFKSDMASGPSTLELDGGTVQARTDYNAKGTYIASRVTTVVKAGGATFDIPAGCVSKIEAALQGDAESTGGGLVKKGAGVLMLTNAGNSYTGVTKVEEGTLILIHPLTTSTLELSAGATVGFDPANWSEEQIAALVAQAKAAGASLAVYVSAETTLAQTIDLGVGGVSKYGPATLALTGTNAWAGDLVIHEGLVKAARGTGLPTAAKVVLEGGTWAPLAAEAAEPVTLPGTEGAVGFTAVGTPLEVNLADGALLTQGPGSFPNGLTLNVDGADQPVVVRNPIAYGTDAQKTELVVTVDSTDANAKAVLAGKVTASNNKNLVKNGAGTLELTGGFMINTGWYVHNAGTTTFSKDPESETTDYALWDPRTYAGTVNIGPGVTYTVGGWARFGMGSAFSTVNVDGATMTVPNNCRLNVSESTGETVFNLNSGSISAGMLYMGYNKGLGTINQRGGTFTMGTGGDSRIGEPDNNTGFVGRGIYNQFDGASEWKGNWMIGCNGEGVVNQSGGTALSSGGWVSVGRYADGVGTYNLTGGTFEKTSNGVLLGELGSGTLNISGTGVFKAPFVEMARATTAKGAVTIGEGGTLETSRVYAYGDSQNSSAANNQTLKGATFAVDGGTVRTTAGTANFFQRLEGIIVGPKGMTFDNNGQNAGFYGSSFAASAGTLTLTGAGTTTLAGQLPPVKEVLVKKGTTVNVAGTGAKELVHRWSFNGDLADSVGGLVATPLEAENSTYKLTEGKVVLPGGTKGQGGSLSLGQNLVPAEGPVTIEIWASIDKDQTWSKMLSIGKDTGNYFILNACVARGDGSTGVSLLANGAQLGMNNTGTGYATRAVEYHYVLTTVPDGKGGTYLTALRLDAATGMILNRVRLYSDAWNWGNIVQSACWLGRSYWADSDASVSVNELRIWKGAMSEDEAIRSATLGVDTLPTDATVAAADDNVLPENPSAELVANDYLLHRWSFNDNSYADSVGGRTAIPKGTVNSVDALNAVAPISGGKHRDFIDLQSNVLPSEGPATVEIWFTPRANLTWSSIFTAGLSGGIADQCSYLTIGQCCGNGGKENRMFVCINNRVNEVGSIPQSVANKPYHVGLTLTPKADGGTVLLLSIHDLAGNLLGSATLDYSNWNLGNLNQTNCWLGQSLYGNDPDVNGIYDEVRIWGAALSEKQLAQNAQLGPDSLPALVPNFTNAGAMTLNVEAGATVNLQGQTVEQSVLTGAGAVENGTLVVTGVLDPATTLTLPSAAKIKGTYLYDVGDTVTVKGDVDLTGAKFELRDATNLKGSQVVMTLTEGTITGTMTHNLKGTGYRLNYTPTRVSLARDSLCVFVR